jgi:hypothetical protein
VGPPQIQPARLGFGLTPAAAIGLWARRYRDFVKTVLLGERPRELEEFLQGRHQLGLDGFDEVWQVE